MVQEAGDRPSANPDGDRLIFGSECWQDGEGQDTREGYGDGTTTDRLEPTPPAVDRVFVSVVAGYQKACGLTTEALAFCWGWNGDGAIGDGTYESRRLPTMVQPAQL